MKQHEALSEEFIWLIQVIAENKELRQWFLSIEKLPENLRYSHIRSMAERMQADWVDSDLVEAVKSLASADVYSAASKTIREYSLQSSTPKAPHA
jgi:hypothetical protein